MPMDTDPVTEPPTEIQIDDPQEPESAETPYGSLFVPLRFRHPGRQVS